MPFILIQNLIYFISVFSNLTLGLFVFLKGRREKVNRTFFYCILTATGWLGSLFLFYAVSSSVAVLWIGRFNFAIVLPLLYFLFEFSLIFPREFFHFPQKLRTVLRIWILLFSLLVFLTPAVGKDEIITGPGERETIYGPLLFLYVIHYIVFSIGVIISLFHKWKRCGEKEERAQIKYVLFGLSLALVWGFVTTIGMSQLGFFDASKYSPIATVIFSSFVTAAIVKHYLFNIRILTTELFTGLLVLLLFINVILASTINQRILNIFILMGTIGFGISLIRSVIQEVKLREEKERLALNLQSAYQELKKIDQTKTEFISIASHQLRTPLTVIKGYVSMLLEGNYGKLPEKGEKALRGIFGSNERLIDLVNDLLTISKIETGKMEFEQNNFSLEEIISSVVEEMNIKAESKKLYLKWEKLKRRIPEIFGDKDKIRHAILNLIDNAIIYTHRGGVTITIEETMDKIRVSVKDTGEGMTKEETDKLFTSFSRGSAGLKCWIEGAGLGLYVARKFVEMHGGRIWAESKGEGRGSTFYIELPIHH